MITKQEQFIGELNTILDNDCAVDARLKYFIDKYDRVIIREIVGVQLYNEIKLALDNPLTGEMAILINGGNYTVDGIDYEWVGLKEITAPFVFYYYHRDNSYNVAQTSGTLPTYENSTIASMGSKMRKVWNEATELIGYKTDKVETLHHFLKNSTFEDYDIKEFKGGKIQDLGWF